MLQRQGASVVSIPSRRSDARAPSAVPAYLTGDGSYMRSTAWRRSVADHETPEGGERHLPMSDCVLSEIREPIGNVARALKNFPRSLERGRHLQACGCSQPLGAGCSQPGRQDFPCQHFRRPHFRVPAVGRIRMHFKTLRKRCIRRAGAEIVSASRRHTLVRVKYAAEATRADGRPAEERRPKRPCTWRRSMPA